MWCGIVSKLKKDIIKLEKFISWFKKGWVRLLAAMSQLGMFAGKILVNAGHTGFPI